jgi:hypothetical protein
LTQTHFEIYKDKDIRLMILPKKFRQWMAEIILKRKLKSIRREKRYYSWDDFTSIGILTRMESEDDFRQIKTIASQLKKSGKEVQVIAYIPDKVIPSYLVSSGIGYFFNMNDLNSFLIPKSDFIQGFIQSRPDVLLDLSFSSSFVIKYIVGLSHAKMKIGNTNKTKAMFYDLMIQIEDESDVNHFLDQVKYYLNVVKSK